MFTSRVVPVLGLVATLAGTPDNLGATVVQEPSFKDVLSLESVSNPQISPDGKSIAYTVTSTDWEHNRYDREIWIVRQGTEPFQLTRTPENSSTGVRWSPDGTKLGFIADRGHGQQIYVVRSTGGEALQLTDVKGQVRALEWSPDGKAIAFLKTEPKPDSLKDREKRYGAFAVDDAEYSMRHLWLIDAVPEAKPARLTEGNEFTVTSFAWSPDGNRIAFSHQPDPLINSSVNSDISVLDIRSKEIVPIVIQPGRDGNPLWSPDGKWVLFNTSDGDSAFYLNRELAKVPAGGGEITVLTGEFDENPSAVAWTDDGIWFIASDHTSRKLYRLDAASRAVEVFGDQPEIIGSVSITPDGRSAAITASSRTTLGEIYRSSLGKFEPELVTNMTEQVEGWPLGTREVVSWKSKDGAAIEGVLFKPADFDAGRRHPLLVVIHGGPTGTSRPVLVSSYVYPITQWLAKGAVILMPNYRGSAGYGEAFRSLNVRNLGVGDEWDVMSGVDYLIDKGIADPDHMGAMGWSQGGYISAFLTTTTGRFKAISVGAGISDWMTYYVNTDIHPFTRHYLQATPWSDPEIYRKTSPMTYINQAKTPTLIQHGEFDRRVPIPNAYELLQGLRDMGVESKLVVYKGFGHGITKPKERLAATWHNWQWFGKYVWGEEIEIPVAVTPDKAIEGGSR
ncbi:MAG: prolyl oligopeptidase family serine peptidase [Gemmatimonadales bacterium]